MNCCSFLSKLSLLSSSGDESLFVVEMREGLDFIAKVSLNCATGSMANTEGNWMVVEQGYILTSEIDGTIQMKSYLSGNPEIKVGLNEDLTIGPRSGGSFGQPSFPGSIILLVLIAQ